MTIIYCCTKLLKAVMLDEVKLRHDGKQKILLAERGGDGSIKYHKKCIYCESKIKVEDKMTDKQEGG